MFTVFESAIKKYRAKTYFLNDPISKLKEAINFVKRRGFVFFWPIKGIELPSLWVAVAGDRPVPAQHDDPGHITWQWKDSQLGERVWYYAKVLRKKATLIDLEIAPYFYALSENYGSPEDDYLAQYYAGQLTQESKAVYEALLYEGPMDTISLRQVSRMTSSESSYRFNKALSELQADFKILPVGISRAGAWRYAFIYELVPRHYPQLPDQARMITRDVARRKLVELYIHSVGLTKFRDLTKLFGWKKKHTEKAINALIETGTLIETKGEENPSETWFVLPDLMNNP
ncbi:MAG: crosslink repair DNA glycosylase YcaQ family protein [Anaerolineales bacterium]|jgi:hypothetical protein